MILSHGLAGIRGAGVACFVAMCGYITFALVDLVASFHAEFFNDECEGQTRTTWTRIAFWSLPLVFAAHIISALCKAIYWFTMVFD